MTTQNSSKPYGSKKTLFTRFLDSVEYLGNLLPHPVTLFAIFCVAILISSGISLAILGYRLLIHVLKGQVAVLPMVLSML